LRGECIIRVVLDGRRVVSQERLLEKQYGRIRDIAEGPDGAIYFSTSNRDGRGKPARDDDRILRLMPTTLPTSGAVDAEKTAQLRAWVGKYPFNSDKSFADFFRVRQLSPRLRNLIGKNYYQRLTFNDNCVITPIQMIANHLIIKTCEAHNCASSESLMAINLSDGEIHVAIYQNQKFEWFHTKGVARDLPPEILQEFDKLMPDRAREVKEITRNGI
jgi:hypothetical protein